MKINNNNFFSMNSVSTILSNFDDALLYNDRIWLDDKGMKFIFWPNYITYNKEYTYILFVIATYLNVENSQLLKLTDCKNTCKGDFDFHLTNNTM